MERTSLVALLMAASLLAGCAKAFLIPEIRSAYDIKTVDDLIVSNSPFFSEQKNHTPQREGGRVVINYAVIVKNNSATRDYELRLDKARLVVADRFAPAQCSMTGSSASLKTGESREVHCLVTLADDSFPELKKQDVIGQFVLPFASGARAGEIAFDYKLKIEDFQANGSF